MSEWRALGQGLGLLLLRLSPIRPDLQLQLCRVLFSPEHPYLLFPLPGTLFLLLPLSLLSVPSSFAHPQPHYDSAGLGGVSGRLQVSWVAQMLDE